MSSLFLYHHFQSILTPSSLKKYSGMSFISSDSSHYLHFASIYWLSWLLYLIYWFSDSLHATLILVLGNVKHGWSFQCSSSLVPSYLSSNNLDFYPALAPHVHNHILDLIITNHRNGFIISVFCILFSDNHSPKSSFYTVTLTRLGSNQNLQSTDPTIF